MAVADGVGEAIGPGKGCVGRVGKATVAAQYQSAVCRPAGHSRGERIADIHVAVVGQHACGVNG